MNTLFVLNTYIIAKPSWIVLSQKFARTDLDYKVTDAQLLVCMCIQTSPKPQESMADKLIRIFYLVPTFSL